MYHQKHNINKETTMEFFEGINALSDPILGDKPKPGETMKTPAPYWVDGDTINKNGIKYRLAGFDTAEIEKMILEGDGLKEFMHKQGTAGGTASVKIMSELANKMGYTNLVPVLDAKGKPQKDLYGRTLANLVNDSGQSFRQKVLTAGILGTSAYSSGLDSAISNMGAIERLENPNIEIKDEWDQARADIQGAEIADGKYSLGVKKLAHNEAELAAANEHGYADYYQQNNVNVRRGDRTITNESLNPLGDSWEQGWLGVLEGGAGFFELSGKALGAETLAQIGEEGVERYRAKLNDYGTTLTDYRDVDSIMSGIRWITNSAAISLPYMAASIAGLAVGNVASVAVGAVAGAAVGLSAPAAIFAGNTYNEMEGDKNAGAALASGIVQATLDRIGLKAIFKIGKAPKALLDDALQALIKKQPSGVPLEIRTRIAQAQLAGASKKVIAEFAGDASKIARQQLGAKELFKAYGTRLTSGMGGEALTETGQEVANYIAATKFSDKPFDMQELNNRMMQAAITGGALGGVFSAPSAISNHVAWADVAFGKMDSDGTEVGQNFTFTENFKKKMGIKHMPTNEQNSQIADEAAKVIESQVDKRAREILARNKRYKDLNSRDDQGIDIVGDTESERERQDMYKEAVKEARSQLGVLDIDSRSQAYQKSWGEKPIENRVGDTLKMFPKLFKSISNAIFSKDVLEISGDAGYMLRDIFGHATSKAFAGEAWESSRIAETFKMLNTTVIAPIFYKTFVKGRHSKANLNKASMDLYSLWEKSINKEGDFDPSLIPDSNVNKAFIVETIESLNNAAEESRVRQNDQAMLDHTIEGKLNTDENNGYKEIAKQKNFFLKHRVLDSQKVKKGKADFKKALIKNGFSDKEANDLIQKIISQGMIDLDEAYSAVKGDVSAGHKKSRTLKMSEKKEFQPFLEQNIFKNVESYAKTQGRYLSHAKFIGKDSRRVSEQLNEIEKNMTKHIGKERARNRVNKMAYELERAINAESGNYKRPETDGGRKLEQIQRSFLLFTTLAGLSLATISSFVELALTGRSFKPHQIDGLLKTQGNELATMLKRGMGEIANLPHAATGLGGNINTATFMSNGQRILNKLGFGDYTLGAATTSGATEINAWQQNIMKGFFKWNGLQGWTNYTRAVRAAMATDFINDKLKIVADYSYLIQKDSLEYNEDNIISESDILSMKENNGDNILKGLGFKSGIDSVESDSDARAFQSLTKDEITQLTKEVTQAHEYLQNLGIDVDTFVDFYMRYELNIAAKNRAEFKIITDPDSTPEMIAAAQQTIISNNESNATSDILVDPTSDLYFLTEQELELRDTQLREAVFNFINEAVALPQTMNRPLIYQDPRFALFTQFQGFMATFTANHMKRMWDEGIARGSPGMRYSTFVTIGTMIMLGFASQALKDWIKHEDGENEHLDRSQYIQRGIRSSGLLGTYERVIDQFMPLYPQGRQGNSSMGTWLLSSAATESPGLSNLKRLALGTVDIASGNVGKGVEKYTASAPIIGSVNRVRAKAGEIGSKIDF